MYEFREATIRISPASRIDQAFDSVYQMKFKNAINRSARRVGKFQNIRIARARPYQHETHVCAAEEHLGEVGTSAATRRPSPKPPARLSRSLPRLRSPSRPRNFLRRAFLHQLKTTNTQEQTRLPIIHISPAGSCSKQFVTLVLDG